MCLRINDYFSNFFKVEHFSVSVFPFEMEWNILIAQFEIIFFCEM